MKLKLLLVPCLLMLGMSAEAKDYKYYSVANDPMHTRIYTLDNGLKVYLSVNKEKPRIQTYIAVRTGSRNDPPTTTGLAHYLEHLMFKGTKLFGTSDLTKEAPLLDSIQNRFEVYRTIKDPAKRKAYYHGIDSLSQVAAKYNIPNEYDKLMSSIGSEGSNAYTSNDVTCYVEDIPSNEVDNWAKIQADRFQNMVIRGFHTELEAVYEEFNIGLANDGEKEWDALNAKLYPNHPYGTQTTIGTQEHLKNPSIVNIKNYFNRYYVPNNVAICMSGDLDPEAVIATIDKYFSSWKPNANLSYPQYAPVRNLTAPVDTSVVGKEAENIIMAWKFDKAASFQADTLDVISKMLYNGKAGLMDLDLDQKMQWLGGGAFADNLAEYSSFLVEGTPKEGQSLDDLRKLILGEISKLKAGNFSDDLLPSVINNMKKNYYQSLESNQSRASLYVDAFINGQKWDDAVNRLNRISGITKKQVVDFANKYLLDNYVAVYKRQGTDTTQKKIDKPQITPIPANRDKQSQFVTNIINSKAEPIQPRFLDFDKDIAKGKTSKGVPVLYVKNNSNGLFGLAYYFKFGREGNKWLPYASSYVDYLGTDKLTAEQLKQQFYKLACNFNIRMGYGDIQIGLSGLSENMPQAIKLMENFLANMKVDKEAYTKYVALVEKDRKDTKLNQQSNFYALYAYGTYGSYNDTRNIPSNKELENGNPQKLVDMIKKLTSYQHTILYYGPAEEKDIIATINKEHKTAAKLLPIPEGRKYVLEQTPKTEILLAPYDAKNIYMRQYHNEGLQWTPDQQPVIELFNEYFGGGMNTVVFQELRETRGLAYNAWAMYDTPWRKGETESAMTHIISQNDKMMDCIRTFNNIVDTIPQSQKAFDLAKQALMKRLASSRTTKLNIIYTYLSALRKGINYDINKKVYEAVPNMTLQDIVNFEQRTMAHKPYRYMILGDEKNLDIKSLEKIAPIKRLTTDEIFGY
jgi:predicted Zn-dependent peptidase